MRIIVTTIGSYGDLQPFLALAVELRQHGHEPIFALPSYFMRHAQRLGFAAVQLGPDLGAAQEEIIRGESQSISNDQRPSLWQPFLAAMPQAFAQLCALCAEADLLISSNMMPLGRIVHDLTATPLVAVRQDWPYQGIFTPGEAEGMLLQYLNGFRAQLGLAPLDDPVVAKYSPQLTLFSVSRALLPPEPDWPAHYHVTGFFFLDEPGWQPDPALTAFLEAGPPPALITLGSTIHDDPATLTRLFLDAIERVGCRALIQQPAADTPLPPTVHAVGYAPYDQLLPHTAAVVHHGGAGTTACAWRAGVPAVVIPYYSDQLPLADWTVEHGYASAAIRAGELNVERLSAALHAALYEPRYREATAALAATIRAEQGVRTARLLIEQLAARLTELASRSA